jgi:acyl carrier protein
MDRRSQIIQIIREVTRKDVSPDPDESLFDAGILDSFGLQDLTLALEKAFSIRIPEDDLVPPKFDSIEKIERYVARHLD